MKYFGTDGIRGIANKELTPELAYKVAKAGAYVLGKHSKGKIKIIIGRDTRISGTLIESAMVSGFLSCGANVVLVGVVPTPGIAYLTKKMNFDAGVVISASHNSFEFNGIKFFSNKGMKLSDEIEEEIEEIIDSQKLEELNVVNDEIGIVENNEKLKEIYIEFILEEFKEKIKNEKFVVAIDTANGATGETATKIFEKLGINYHIINNEPNGININKQAGSTHLEKLKEYVIKNKCDLGVAYDGDGDRCLACDEKGNIIDGDIILAIISNYLKSKNKLKNNTVVATVMSNLGLKKYCKNNNIIFNETKVGDRYVLENMLETKANLGGEQSGHIIFLDYNPTGDGIFTSLMLINSILESKKTVSELAEIIKIYPQVLINAKVKNENKYEFDKNEEIKQAIKKLEQEFKDNGRILIRPSGTEPLVRVMIEGEDKKNIQEQAEKMAKLIEEKCI